jgi:DNA-binding CsgD family transcriptional regulator
VTGAFSALSALLRVIDGAGPEAIDEVRDLDAQGIPMNAAIVGFAEAVLVGRAGDLAGARAAADAADTALGATGMVAVRHLVRRLVADAAITDGWMDVSGWLTGAMSSFTASGHDRLAAACRDLLRTTGSPVPRAAGAALPELLREAGVSAREAEVLDLVGERLTNREIADRLYLSARTVEKHVERLLQKLQARDRLELGHLARTSRR